MKKFLSMLLVLTMIATTLMGVMVIDVSAKSTINTSTDPDTITLQFGLSSLPGNESNMNGVYGIGDWYAYGYSYTDEDVAKDPASNTITGTKTESVNFLSTSKVENPLVGDMMKFDWKPGVIYDDTYKAFKANTAWLTDGKSSANYARLRILSPVTEGKITSVTTASYGKITGEAIYQYTFYAYTDPNTTLDNKTNSSSRILLAHTLAGSAHIDPNIYSNQLPSANGVPHKVDVVFSSNGTTNYVNVYIDGVQQSDGLSKANDKSKEVAFVPRFYDVALQSATSITLQDTDWYITLPSSVPGSNITTVTQDDVKADLIVVPNFNSTTKATAFRTDDYITGVIDSLDKDIKAVLETTKAGDKVVDIYESNYNNPASLFDTSVENPTVKLVSKTTGEEVAVENVANTTMDDYYFMVNGIYVIPNEVDDPLPYVEGSVVFPSPSHNSVVTRTWHEDYVKNAYPEDAKPFGGLTSGFYRYANEPRSGMAFSNSDSMYNSNGYVALNTHSGEQMPKNKTTKLSSVDVEKNIATAEFDLFLPEYTANSTNDCFRITAGVLETDLNNNAGDHNIYFTTGGLGNMATNNNAIDLEPNSWNTISLQYDLTTTANDGVAYLKVFVNSVLNKTITFKTVDKTLAAEYFVPLRSIRFYSPKYVQYGVKGAGKWYFGDYKPTATPISKGEINVNDEKITVDESNLLISSSYEKEEDLVEAMPEKYIPVYATSVDIDAVEAAYTAADGTITVVSLDDEKYKEYIPTGATKAYKGKIIKRWLESDEKVATFTTEDNKSVYTPVASQILKATDIGNDEAIVALSAGYGYTTYKAGVCTNLQAIISENPDAETVELIGFAIVEEGKLPKVYSLAENGLKLRSLNYNLTENQAELTYRKFGTGFDTSYTFQIVVGAYNKDGKLLDIKAEGSKTLNASTPDGEVTLPFAPNFSDEVKNGASFYKVFVLDSLTTAKPVMASVKVNK